MQKILAIVLLLPLAGCFADRESQWIPSDIAPMFGGGGSAPARPLPAQPAPGSQAPGTGVAKMLQDPDDPYNSQIIDYVWGDTEQQAIARCEAIAQQDGLRYVKVRQTSKNGKKWECHVDNL